MENIYDRVKIVVFSIHGTLVRGRGPEEALRSADDIRVIPGVRPILKRLLSEGYHAVGVINITDDVFRYVASDSIVDYFGAVTYLLDSCNLDEIYYSWKNGSNRWMPYPGMISDIAFDYCIPKDNMLFVGSTQVDYVTAKNAGVKFSIASEFFNHMVVKIK